MKISRNAKGKDFIVGDIHGHYDLLMEGLERISFCKQNDRLFSVGDLIDRGPESLKCMSLNLRTGSFLYVGITSR